jgi:MATE family multidrug resistance protein
MYFIWFNAEGILLGLKQDPEVARLAALYLRWVSLGLPGMSILLMFSEYILNKLFAAYAFNLISRYDPRPH